MANFYINSYIIIFIFFIIGLLLPIVALTLGKLLRPHKPKKNKLETYESGIDPFHDSRVRFHIHYYVVALMFVIFDLETIFLYAWAVAYESLGLFAVIEMMIFVAMLFLGLIYAWKKGALKWS